MKRYKTLNFDYDDAVGDTDLVTAAPELYEALDNLLTRLSYDKDAKAWFPEEQERARCALRKARGE